MLFLMMPGVRFAAFRLWPQRKEQICFAAPLVRCPENDRDSIRSFRG